MSPTSPDRAPGRWFLEGAERFLESLGTRLVLSFLIIVSVLPEATLAALLPAPWVERLPLFFLAIFGPELILRTAVYGRRYAAAEATGWEPAFLLLDLLAVVSFLPLHLIASQLAYLRLFRLTRMLLLLGYWGGTVRELWAILTAREWRYQVFVVLMVGALLAFGAAVLLTTLGASYDFDESGTVDEADRRFSTILWWSFLQVEDPGNLVRDPRGLLVVGASMLLTLGGVLLFSFLVGIGTSAVEELMARGREKPVDLSGHSVILGVGPYSHLLLSELGELYRKNRRRFRAALLGSDPSPPDFLHQRAFRSVRYRHGSPVDSLDLERLDVARARRVLVLGPAGREPDSEVISAILATRRLNPAVAVYAALEHEKNFLAAREAGGAGTHPIGAGSFLGYYLAQNVLHPGIDGVFRQLLTTTGCEIYTYLFSAQERRILRARGGGPDLRTLWAEAFVEWNVSLAGFLVGPEASDGADVEDLEVILNPAGEKGRPGIDPAGRLDPRHIHGLVGICLRWDDLRRFGRYFVAQGETGASHAIPSESALPGVRLRSLAAAPRRVLVCGDSRRVPRVCQVLLDVRPDAEILVLSRASSVEPVARDVESALRGFLAGLPPERGERPLDIDLAADEALMRRPEGGTVRILRLDWTDGRRLLQDPTIDLPSAEMILFVPQREELEEPEGQVALDCLRLAHVAGAGLVRLAPGLRVVGMVGDPVKGDLLEDRLDRLSAEGRGPAFTILATERLRNHFIVQNLFVPALNRVYLELLGVEGEGIGRWGLETRRDSVRATDLAHELWRDGILLLGLEIRDPDDSAEEPRIVLDPRDLRELGEIEAERIRAVIGLARSDRG